MLVPDSLVPGQFSPRHVSPRLLVPDFLVPDFLVPHERHQAKFGVSLFGMYLSYNFDLEVYYFLVSSDSKAGQCTEVMMMYFTSLE